jgi:hypothetical protein
MSYLDMFKAAQEGLSLCELSEKRSSLPSSTKEGEVSPAANYANEAKKAYAHPWPDTIAPLGQRRVGHFDPCARACGRWSWVRFGDVVLCLPCANREVGP